METIQCLECGVTFRAKRSRGRIFCSRQCAGCNLKHRKKISQAKQNKFVNDLSTKASFVHDQLRRFISDKCLVCGWVEDYCDVHHVILRSRGGTNRIDNLTMLCPNCHREAHEGTLKEFPTIAQAYPLLPAASRRV